MVADSGKGRWEEGREGGEKHGRQLNPFREQGSPAWSGRGQPRQISAKRQREHLQLADRTNSGPHTKFQIRAGWPERGPRFELVPALPNALPEYKFNLCTSICNANHFPTLLPHNCTGPLPIDPNRAHSHPYDDCSRESTGVQIKLRDC